MTTRELATTQKLAAFDDGAWGTAVCADGQAFAVIVGGPFDGAPYQGDTQIPAYIKRSSTPIYDDPLRATSVLQAVES